MNDLMRRMQRPSGLLAVLCVAVVSGCSLGRSEPPQRHYVLAGETTRVAGAQSPGLAGLKIGVRRLRLAPYLDPPFLVVRRGPNQITYAEFHRWGEPLAGGINRAFAGHLAARADFLTIDAAPWAPREAYDYVIQLHVERFEGVTPSETATSGGEIHMLATWEIVRQQDGAVLARGTTEHREGGWNVGDYAALVHGLDAGLALLSRDLAGSLEALAIRAVAQEGAGTRP
jgi:uncharacterized protein